MSTVKRVHRWGMPISRRTTALAAAERSCYTGWEQDGRGAVPAIVTLLSDFGSHSPYPAQMKAVLAGSCDAVFIDITHDVPRHDVRQVWLARRLQASKLPCGRRGAGRRA